jgi:hypothetical protein
MEKINLLKRTRSSTHPVNKAGFALSNQDVMAHEPLSAGVCNDTFAGLEAVSGYTHYKSVGNFFRKTKHRSDYLVARAVVAKGVWHMLTKNEEYKGFKGQPVRAASQTCWPQPINPHA